ncbi:putative RAD54-DNA-dependent ATPase of the Snf2p family [Acaromyces ingoldii]|uniref:Putative RAD54-DNA-dependent ATPase of the Snf2p family n=1 Tax=Acaromyces ingoldii TaxID=215250 RepID=A0A316YIL5_9BASI|nr:putative RAD54-DNA-dependent ATPase of the Snf2p family [Acaromyces ingoldii]PWN88674.1 putative RAD54-DNA-dependent ATPase of the Snf2p family [Acaromyces ingoldii]
MRRSVVLAALGESSPSRDGAQSSLGSYDVKTAIGGGFGPLLGKKPFKVPLGLSKSKNESDLGRRKRKQVDYKGMGGDLDDGDDEATVSDDEGGPGRPAKKAKKGKTISLEGMKGVDANGRSLKADNRKWEVFKPKKESIHKRFSIPVMRAKNGEIVETRLSGAVLGTRQTIEVPPRPLHDPMGEHAIVLFDPTVDDREAEKEKERIQKEQEEAEKKLDEGGSPAPPPTFDAHTPRGPHKSLADILGIRRKRTTDALPVKVPVVIDPKLAKVLRPHQVEGVKFLYRCATGLIADNAFGSIMADEMGLGKTLQCITLMWTLLKQSPVPRKPTIEKCVIACPSSLVRNWANELVKWLGASAPGNLALDGKLSKEEMVAAVRRWADNTGKSVTQPVLIVSYETLRNITGELGSAEVGLLLCDEGHRLKNADSLTYEALDQINVKRRVILSGTPIQNDLTEYFSLVSFANPDLLGGRLEFRKKYEIPILKGRDAEATEKEQEDGKAKLQELTATVSKFIIRRTNDLLSKYLPVKYEHVVFCRMSPFQLALYNHFVNSPEIQRLLRGKGSQPLKAINILKKLCNHPNLLDLPNDLPGCEAMFPPGYNPRDHRNTHVELSGKMMVLERFLSTIRATSKDKVVLISNYTQTLDLFERMCRNKKWGLFRLDGTMAVAKRQKFVDRFNDPEGAEFVFLLSSKAGGCGINLIGANRLVLFDPDWNPASDQQALARVWRDGQKKTCFVYRFISTGSIEEKILQRQSHKQTLSSCVVDDAQDAERHFSSNDLRELFKFNKKTDSDTHDTYKCKRCAGGKQISKASALLYGDTSTWNHWSHDELGKVHDDLLRTELSFDDVSYAFQYCSH